MDIFWPFGFLSWFQCTKQTIKFPVPIDGIMSSYAI